MPALKAVKLEPVLPAELTSPRYVLFKEWLGNPTGPDGDAIELPNWNENWGEIPADALQVAVTRYHAFQASKLNHDANAEARTFTEMSRQDRAERAAARKANAELRRQEAEQRKAEREAAKATKAAEKAAQPAKASKATKATKAADPSETVAATPKSSAPAKATKAPAKRVARKAAGARAPEATEAAW